MLIYLFFIGCCCFSFLNVVIDRSQHQQSFIVGKSQCDYCQHTLLLIDMIPIMSQLFNRSQCRYCHKHYSWSYLYIELIGGLCFLYLYHHHTLLHLWWFYYGIYYFELSLSDIKYYNIIFSHWFINSIIWISIGYFYFHYHFFWLETIMYLIVIHLIYPLIKNKIGYGDILIFTTIIFPFGFLTSTSIILIACLFAILFFIIRYYQTQSEVIIPFVPFMSLGILIYHLL